MIKLSIIVPIYNVAPYLRMCVASLLNQDLARDEYEIILVDDGSTDTCPAICDEYAVAHSNIRVVHRKNGGLSAARNSGIEVAQGEYMMFVDSDDYIEPNVLGSLLKQIDEEQLDILRYNYRNVRIVNREYEVFEPFKNYRPYVYYDDVVLTGEQFLNEKLGYACYVCHFIIKSELVKRKGNLFKPGIYFEDTDWTPRILLQANRVSSSQLVVYNYLWREGSITLPDNPEKKKKVLEDKISLLKGYKEQQLLVNDKRWYVWLTAVTTMSILWILSTYESIERKPYITQLRSMHIFPLSTYRANRNNRIKILMANISPSIYCKLMKMIHK